MQQDQLAEILAALQDNLEAIDEKNIDQKQLADCLKESLDKLRPPPRRRSSSIDLSGF